MDDEREIPPEPGDRDAAPDAYEPEAIPTRGARIALWLGLGIFLLLILLVVIFALTD